MAKTDYPTTVKPLWIRNYDSATRVATLKLDLGSEHKQNLLTRKVMEELGALVDYYLDNPPTALIIASAKEDSFCAGGDIEEISGFLGEEGSRRVRPLMELGHDLVLKIYHAPFPIVAAVSGDCHGGGLELALACHARVATNYPKTRFSLPETKLGIIPGLGGTQLLPRVVGLAKATEVIVGQRTLSAKEAKQCGLVDKIVDHPAELLSAALSLALQVRKNPRRRVGIEKIPVFGPKIILREARRRVLAETHGNYPALLFALKAIEASYLDLYDGLAKERRLFAECLQSWEARSLIELFFLRKEARSKNWTGQDTAVTPPNRVGVLGGGIMGRGIAYAVMSSGLPVLLHDLYPEVISSAVIHIEGLLKKEVVKGKITPAAAERRRSLLSVSYGESLRRFSEVDFVIEAVSEDLRIKSKVLGSLGQVTRPGTTVVTNTSSLLPSEVARSWKEPENFGAMHFFNPANVMDLVEIAGHSQTSPLALAKTVELAKVMGKTPVVLDRECAGLVVNRILPYYIAYALEYVTQGAHPKLVDQEFESFGMMMGPFKTLDLVGFDVAQHVFEILERSYPGSLPDLSGLGSLAKDKRFLGQKSGQGFYIWEKGKPKRFNEKILSHFGLKPESDKRGARRIAISVCDMSLVAMYEQACKVVAEGVCRQPEMIDLLLILGVGFAPNRRGLFGWARDQGMS